MSTLSTNTFPLIVSHAASSPRLYLLKTREEGKFKLWLGSLHSEQKVEITGLLAAPQLLEGEKLKINMLSTDDLKHLVDRLDFNSKLVV